MDATHDHITKTLQVPDVARGSHYNERSGLIILEGPRGNLLARYADPSRPPDPERFKFQTCFPRNYTTFDKTEPPAQAPADISAYAYPVEKNLDPRMGVASGSAKSPAGGAPAHRNDPSLILSPQQGHNQPLPDLKGMEITQAQTNVRGSDSGLSVGDKVKVSGGFEQPNTENKGLMSESSLSSIVPDTAITFPASSYLPNVKKMQQMRQMVSIVRKLPALAASILRIGRSL